MRAYLLKGAGKTIIISSHVLSELSELCTDIGIIDQGHMVLEGEIGDILSRVNTSNPLLISVYSGRETALAVLRGHPLVQTISVQDQDISVRFSGNAQEEAMLLQQLMENGVLVIRAKNKLRLLPALNIPLELLEKAIEILKKVCR